MYAYTCILYRDTYLHIYIYIEREREGERNSFMPGSGPAGFAQARATNPYTRNCIIIIIISSIVFMFMMIIIIISYVHSNRVIIIFIM